MFPSYIDHPKNCKFEGQDSDEIILLMLRAHPITNLGWIIPALIFFILPFITTKTVSLLGFSTNFVPETVALSFLIINYLLVLVISFEGFLHWYFNVTLITNKKVVDVDFNSLLYKSVSLAPLDKIEETDSTITGFLGTIFHYGDVTIQTAGAKVAIEMVKIPKPAIVADLILDLTQKTHRHITEGGNNAS